MAYYSYRHFRRLHVKHKRFIKKRDSLYAHWTLSANKTFVLLLQFLIYSGWTLCFLHSRHIKLHQGVTYILCFEYCNQLSFLYKSRHLLIQGHIQNIYNAHLTYCCHFYGWMISSSAHFVKVEWTANASCFFSNIWQYQRYHPTLIDHRRADEGHMTYFALRASPKICLHITSNIVALII